MIWSMFYKDCLELLRDRKHLLITIVLPIVVTPLLIFGTGYLQTISFNGQINKPLSYFFENPEQFTELDEKLANDDGFQQQTSGSAEAVEQGELDLYLAVTSSKPFYQLKVVFRETDTDVSKIRRVKKLIEPLSEQLVNQQLLDIGVAETQLNALLSPIQIDETNLITDNENSADLLGNILPFFICLWIIASATGTSSDLVAGEKERGTLETLIISPIPLPALIGGKWLVLTVFSWMTGILTFLSLYVSVIVIGRVTGDDFLLTMVDAISILALLAGILAMLPTAGLVCAVFFVSASISQSFKEAQSYAGGLMMLFFVPLFPTLTGTVDLNLVTSFIPIMNSSLAFSAILQGTFHVGYFVPILLSNAFVSMAILTFSLIMFRSEKVLSRR